MIWTLHVLRVGLSDRLGWLCAHEGITLQYKHCQIWFNFKKKKKKKHASVKWSLASVAQSASQQGMGLIALPVCSLPWLPTGNRQEDEFLLLFGFLRVLSFGTGVRESLLALQRQFLKGKIEAGWSLVPLLSSEPRESLLNLQSSFLWLIHCENIVRNTPEASPVLALPKYRCCRSRIQSPLCLKFM